MRAELADDGNTLAVMPGQPAVLSGDGWSVPVNVRAVAATSGDDDTEARRLLGPGYVLDDDAEEWAAVIVTYGGQTRIASSFLPPAEVARLLNLGLKEALRIIERGENRVAAS